MNIDLGSLVSSPLFGFVLAPFVKAAVDKLKSQIGTLDRSSAGVKQATAIGIAAVSVLLGHAIAVNPSDVGSFIQHIDPTTATSIAIAGLGAIVSKVSDQKAASKDVPDADQSR